MNTELLQDIVANLYVEIDEEVPMRLKNYVSIKTIITISWLSLVITYFIIEPLILSVLIIYCFLIVLLLLAIFFRQKAEKSTLHLLFSLIATFFLISGTHLCITNLLINREPISNNLKSIIRNDIQIQLDQTFSDRFIIREVYKTKGGFMRPADEVSYWVVVYPKRKYFLRLRLEIEKMKEHWEIQNMATTVDFKLFNDDLNDVWKPIIRKYFGYPVKYHLYGVREIRPAYNSFGQLMNYQTYIEKFPKLLRIRFEFNRRNVRLDDKEYRKVFKFVKYLQENQTNIMGISINYAESTLIIRDDQIKNIKKIEDLEQHVLTHTKPERSW